jgi:hypothetical protein
VSSCIFYLRLQIVNCIGLLSANSAHFGFAAKEKGHGEVERARHAGFRSGFVKPVL